MGQAAWALVVAVSGCGGSGISVAPPDDTGTTASPIDDPPDTRTDDDTATDPPPDTAAGSQPWRHTVVVDGDPTDLLPQEAFPTRSGTAWLTWDDTHLFVGVEHPDVVAGGAEHWVLVYVGDGATGTTTGVPFNTQQPDLPAPFTHLLRWKADDSWHSWMTWDGSTWQDAPLWLGTAGSAHAEDEAHQTLELALPLAAIGATDTVAVHVSWVYEGTDYESSYDAVPASSFVDGFDPDFGAYYAFALDAPTPPTDTPPSR